MAKRKSSMSDGILFGLFQVWSKNSSLEYSLKNSHCFLYTFLFDAYDSLPTHHKNDATLYISAA